MGPFLRGFALELIKVSAFSQQEARTPTYDSGAALSAVMSQVSGVTAREGLKQGQPVLTAPAQQSRAPVPVTTPTSMVNGMPDQP